MLQKLALFLCAATSAVPQSSTPPGQELFTRGSANGRAWKAFSSGERVAYLTGGLDMLRVIDAPTEKAEMFKAPHFSVEEMTQCVSQFYAAPENVVIAIHHATAVCVIKFNGGTPERVESVTINLRRIALKNP